MAFPGHSSVRNAPLRRNLVSTLESAFISISTSDGHYGNCYARKIALLRSGMKLHSPKFRISLVVLGTVLSLCACMSEIPSIISQFFFVTEVFVPGALPPKEQYSRYVSLTTWSVGEGWYKLGNYWSDLALKNRPEPDMVGLEESFVSTLISLTKYEEAKTLLAKLPPLSPADPSSQTLSARRRALLTQACMGLHQYKSVATITNNTKMDLSKTCIFEEALAQNSFVANLCINDNQAALHALERYRTCRQKERFGFDASNESLTVVGKFLPVMTLPAHDQTKARQICKLHLDLWTIAGSDPDAIPMLEAAGLCMSDRGYLDEALSLTDAAQKLRAKYHSGII